MFKVPTDIVLELKKEFPNVPVEQFIDKLFDKIFKKTITLGSCAVTRLGTFFAYKAFSNRIHKIVPRFKFSISRALRTKIVKDDYIIEQIPETRESDERMAIIAETMKQIKEKEVKKRVSKKRKPKKTPQDVISEILDEGFYNKEEEQTTTN